MKKVHLNLTILFLSICFGGFAPAAGAQFHSPVLQWMKYLQVNETSYSGGTAWPVPDGLAFTDGRVRPDGFGGECALRPVSILGSNLVSTYKPVF